MNHRSHQLFVLALISFALLLATGESRAACKNESVKLKVNEHGLWLKPDGLPKCLYVDDLAAVDVTFAIDLSTPGSYSLANGQVIVRNAPIKIKNGVEVECSSDLSLDGDFTNTGEQDILVRVIGTDIDPGAIVCYEIVVEEIGMIDPRAEIIDQGALRTNLAAELTDLIAAYDLITQSGLGDALLGTSLDDFLEDSYGLSEADARQMVYKNMQE